MTHPIHRRTSLLPAIFTNSWKPSRSRTQYALVQVIAAVYEGRISHGGWGLDDQDRETSRFLFNELSSPEIGVIDMAGFHRLEISNLRLRARRVTCTLKRRMAIMLSGPTKHFNASSGDACAKPGRTQQAAESLNDGLIELEFIDNRLA